MTAKRSVYVVPVKLTLPHVPIVDNSIMATKRKNMSAQAETNMSVKRARSDRWAHDDEEAAPTGYKISSRIDQTYGQRAAFPGLNGTDGAAELFYGPASDGVEYLRMVRYVSSKPSLPLTMDGGTWNFFFHPTRQQLTDWGFLANTRVDLKLTPFPLSW